MVEIRASFLPAAEPLYVPQRFVGCGDGALRPLMRGLLFTAALSLPVLGSVAAEWFRGSVSRPAQGVAVPSFPPNGGAAAILQSGGPSRIVPVKLAQSLVPR